MANNERDIAVALAKAVASRNLPDEAIKGIASNLANIEHEIKRIDICKFGICLDFWTDQELSGSDIVSPLINSSLGEFRIFKYGILNPDLFHTQTELGFEQLNL